MRRYRIMLPAVLLLATTLLSGCFGKFALTRKVYEVNAGVSDKFLRSGVLWLFLFIPVYNVTAFLDFVIFNTIEFWSGQNPVAATEKTLHYTEGDRSLRIHARRDGNLMRYRIEELRDGNYVEAGTISWDVRSGASAAVPAGNAVSGTSTFSPDPFNVSGLRRDIL